MVFLPACVEHPIGQPAGSNNFDDPDDPGQTGQNSSGPDASGDAWGRSCLAARDCPAAYACAYSLAEGCSADGGVCVPFDTSTCDASIACGCDDTNILLCNANGYSANQPIKAANACNAPPQDAGNDSAADAATTDADMDAGTDADQ